MIDKPSDDKLSGMRFDEALSRFARTSPKEVVAVANASMKDGEIERLIAAFEEAAHVDEDGTQYWDARALKGLLEYEDYRNFLNIVEKAKISCLNTGQAVEDHFVEVTEMIELGKGATREIENIRLTRYACYLITQNGDPKKKPVAFGQSYFAIQTRRQELADEAVAIPSSEDGKRVFLRDQIKEHNRHLASAAKDAGVVTPREFAIFHSKGYLGLYGKTVSQIQKYKGIPTSADILDRMGSTELAANFFRVTQTEEKLRKQNIRNKERAYATHYAVGRQVRDAMLKISGIAPEDLPPADSIHHATKRLRAESGLAAIEGPAPAPQRHPAKAPAPLPADDLFSDDRRPINLREDLWKFALLIMATKPEGTISTSDLIAELPDYIHVPEGSQEVLTGRKDSKFSQIVRNLKSHKTAKTNFIYQGYADAVADGFRITDKGREFVKTYFTD